MKNIRYMFFTILFLCYPIAIPILIYNIYENISSLLLTYGGYIVFIILLTVIQNEGGKNKFMRCIINIQDFLFSCLIELSSQSSNDPKAGIEWAMYIVLSILTFGLTTSILIVIRLLTS